MDSSCPGDGNGLPTGADRQSYERDLPLSAITSNGESPSSIEMNEGQPDVSLHSTHHSQGSTTDGDRTLTVSPQEMVFRIDSVELVQRMPDSPRFRKLRFHERGGLGQVFEAMDEQIQRRVAIKEIREDRANDRSARTRFLTEAAITGRLEHPAIVPVYELGTYSDGRPYYAMRFVRGVTLRQAIQRYHELDATRDLATRELEVRRLLSRFLAVCDAVAFAHRHGVIHRDLKPDNILLGDDGETFLVDWGLAKVTAGDSEGANSSCGDPVRSWLPSDESDGRTMTGDVIGTPHYMSPEHAAGDWSRVGGEATTTKSEPL